MFLWTGSMHFWQPCQKLTLKFICSNLRKKILKDTFSRKKSSIKVFVWARTMQFWQYQSKIFARSRKKSYLMNSLENFFSKTFLWTHRSQFWEHHSKNLVLKKVFKNVFCLKMSNWAHRNNFWEHRPNSRSFFAQSLIKTLSRGHLLGQSFVPSDHGRDPLQDEDHSGSRPHSFPGY